MKYEQSAGGVVLSTRNGVLSVIIARPTNHSTWVFPKGRLDDHGQSDTREVAALREVEEEVGAKGEILHELAPVTYTYEWKGEQREKTVYMFVMKYLEGDITKHDWEMEDVIWATIDEARSRLTHDQSKKILEEAITWVENNGGIA